MLTKTIRLRQPPREAYLVHHGRLYEVHRPIGSGWSKSPAEDSATIVTYKCDYIPAALAREALELALNVLPRHPVDRDTIAADGVARQAASTVACFCGCEQDAHWLLLNSSRAALTLTEIGTHADSQRSWVLEHDYAAHAVEALCAAEEVEDLVEALLRIAPPGPHPAVAL